MANLNKTLIIGRLTRDPETKFISGRTCVCDIGLAVNRKYGTSDEQKEETTFIDVTLWGRTAEVADKYLNKGDPLFVEGRLQMDSWDDKQTGQKRTKLKVVGESIEFLGGKKDQADHADTSPSKPTRPRVDEWGDEEENQRIPF